ncbi:MAG: glycoside hydrolase family 3 N-terminal domain-containing protein [Bacteroidia bacterium]|nr:glycoside hydrolase family 3 N-terminal domain-containing protein [Bacteroidia bacterium]
MKRVLKILGFSLLGLLALLLLGIGYVFVSGSIRSNRNLSQLGPRAPLLEDGGLTFRDLNKNGRIDVYEDRRQPLEARVSDLLSQMTLEEKAGTMFHTIISTGSDGTLAELPDLANPFSFAAEPNSTLLIDKRINHFNLFMTPPPRALAQWHNAVQEVAERTRLGIPVTISSDPRHHFTTNELASSFAKDFSLWPEPLGLAAIGDSALVQRFADMARQEYRAAGIRVALHPMADLATEPRWPRINGTFGEDARLSARLTAAYIRGFQGNSLSASSVACMTKHFSGGGPQKEGLDPHFQFQKGQIYPGNRFDYHLIPFEAAFAAGTAQIMPYYGVPVGQTSEDVGFAFNKDIITGLLRDKYRFDGVVCTDWGVISDTRLLFWTLPARAHGVMELPAEERMLKAIEAGVDQFGGESLPGMLAGLVRAGKISEARIDESVRRILRDKFRLGLFDNPFLDVEHAVRTVGNADYQAAGLDAQRRSLVLLKNGTIGQSKALPLAGSLRIYVEGIDKQTAGRYATVVDQPQDADVAIIRLSTPFEPRSGLLANLFHHGDLDFKGEEQQRILGLLRQVPTIVNLYLERPAVVPEIAEASAGLIANFGATDAALLDVIFGTYRPEGRLPVELPASMEAVRQQLEDVPYDSQNPLFPFGFGLEY